MNPDIKFLDLVQLHERKWGEVQYPGRPALADLMSAPIVVMWTCKGRFMFTVHQSADQVNELVFNVATGENAGTMRDWKLGMIYVDQRPLKFKIKIVSDAPEAKTASKNPTKPIGEQSADDAQYKLKVAKVNPLRTPRWITAVESREPIAIRGEIIKTHVPDRVMPGRNIQLHNKSDGTK